MKHTIIYPLLCLILISCETKAGSGALIGGAGGALIGGVAGGGTGALIGAGAGAVGGARDREKGAVREEGARRQRRPWAVVCRLPLPPPPFCFYSALFFVVVFVWGPDSS